MFSVKKYFHIFIGAIIGAAIMIVGTAAADTISLKGKKIESEADVVVDGVKIGTAILIEGKSYAPVRVIGEAAGFNVDFKDWTVILETPSEKESAPVVTEDVSDIDAKIKELQIEMKIHSTRLSELTGLNWDEYTEEEYKKLQEEHAATLKRASELNDEITRLKKLKEESSK